MMIIREASKREKNLEFINKHGSLAVENETDTHRRLSVCTFFGASIEHCIVGHYVNSECRIENSLRRLFYHIVDEIC